MIPGVSWSRAATLQQVRYERSDTWFGVLLDALSDLAGQLCAGKSVDQVEDHVDTRRDAGGGHHVAGVNDQSQARTSMVASRLARRSIDAQWVAAGRPERRPAAA